jgi:hypothetical protein
MHMMTDPYLPDPLDIFRDMDARGDFDPFEEEEDFPRCRDCGEGDPSFLEENEGGETVCLFCRYGIKPRSISALIGRLKTPVYN